MSATQDEYPVAALVEDIHACMDTGCVAAIAGPPGVGKTAMIAEIAKKRGGVFYTLIGSQCDPTDINGFPVVMQGPDSLMVDSLGRKHPVLQFAPRSYLVELEKKGGTLFLDEFTCAVLATQSAMLRGLCDWCFGDFQLDRKRVSIIVAYNPPEQAVNGHELAPPTLNRLEHFVYPTGQQARYEWCAAFPGYWGNPPSVGFGNSTIAEEHMLRARSYVAGYIRKQPASWLDERLDSTTKKATGGAAALVEPGFCTPRSWDRVAKHLGWCLQNKTNILSASRRIGASIGASAAAAFLTHMRTEELPDPEYLIDNPDKYANSGKVDRDYAVVMSVAAAVAHNPLFNRMTAALHILEVAIGKKGNKQQYAYEAGMAAARTLGDAIRSPEKQQRYRAVNGNPNAAEWNRQIRHLATQMKPFLGVLDLQTGQPTT